MDAPHVLLNLLKKKSGKEIKCEVCPAFYLFFATSLFATHSILPIPTTVEILLSRNLTCCRTFIIH